MSIADTQKARLYANRAEVAAAQCQIYTDEARRAPEYTDLAKQYAEIAEASEEAATIAAQSAQQSSNSASSDASNAIQASSEAQNARDSAVSSAESASSSATSASDSEEIAQQSALSASESAATAAAAVSKTIRVNDTDISPIPDVASRANKVLSFDASGNPIATTPSSGSAGDVLNELAAPGGVSLVNGAVSESNLLAPSAPSMIGVMPQGNLSQLLIYVTPEQFGAIGDGTVHPLSERYSTLAAAQAVYPFVTALTQTIDWAACQKADSYSRGKCVVRCPYARYHFGSSDYLSLGINSKWYGVENTPLSMLFGTTMIRTKPSVKPSFGQDSVVRVMNASDAGSSDEFVRGVEFIGIQCSRGVDRRSASKYDGTICFHANMAMKAKIGVSVSGGEYGAYGYVCWGMTGYIKYDSCHKAIWFDAASPTPEFTPSASSALTSMDLRIEGDASPFGITLRRCKYSKFHGFIEGVLANSTYANYDYTNETAIAMTCYGCDSIDFTEMGIEAWQGIHSYVNSATVSVNMSWTQDYKLLNTTGKHGPYQSLSTLMGTTELFTIPSTNNSYYYALSTLNACFVTLRNMTGDMSTSEFANTFLVTTDANSRFCLENCGIYFGSSRLIHPSNGFWSNISFINDRFFKDYFSPANFTWVGNGRSQSSSWALAQIGATGQVTLTAPTGWSLVDFSTHTLVGSNTQAGSAGIIGLASAPTSSSVTLQTNFSGTSGTYSVYYKLIVVISK